MTASTSVILTFAAASLAGMDAHPPVYLTAIRQTGRVVVRVCGLADAPFVARYTLDTVSGSNRAHQSGGAHLVPGVMATFITLNLSSGGSWSAVLRVEPEHGAPYEQRLGKQSSSQP